MNNARARVSAYTDIAEALRCFICIYSLREKGFKIYTVKSDTWNQLKSKNKKSNNQIY